MTYALVRNGQVVNVAVVDPATSFGQAWLDAAQTEHEAVVSLDGVDPQPGIGWLYSGDSFTPPE